MKCILIITFCFISNAFIAVSLFAQNEALIRTKFRVMPVQSAKWTGIYYKPEVNAPMQELKFQSLSRSFNRYSYYGVNPIIFYRENGRNDDGELTYKEVGKTSISNNQTLIIFVPNAANNLSEFNLISLDDSPKGLPNNHLSFINITGIQLACRFLEKNQFLKPGLTGPISLQEAINENVFIGLAIQDGDRARVILKNNWYFYTGNRHLILLLPPKKPGSYKIQAYRISEFVGENKEFYTNSVSKP
ncbi:MAG: hypothetical protein VXZ08_05540 [Verrucomicrobiota bacterium]|nr:hypothetical protein [Verrucomicrobiota bacterium]